MPNYQRLWWVKRILKGSDHSDSENEDVSQAFDVEGSIFVPNVELHQLKLKQKQSVQSDVAITTTLWLIVTVQHV